MSAILVSFDDKEMLFSGRKLWGAPTLHLSPLGLSQKVLLVPLMEEETTPMLGGGESSVAEPPQVAGMKRARKITQLEKLGSQGSMHASERYDVKQPTRRHSAAVNASAAVAAVAVAATEPASRKRLEPGVMREVGAYSPHFRHHSKQLLHWRPRTTPVRRDSELHQRGRRSQ